MASCVGIGGVWPLALVDGETSDLVLSEGGFVEWAGRPSVEQGRDCGEREIPPSHVLSEGGVVVGRKSHRLAFLAREGLVEGGGWQVVGRQSLPLVFRARVVVVVGANLLHHSNRKWEGPGW